MPWPLLFSSPGVAWQIANPRTSGGPAWLVRFTSRRQANVLSSWCRGPIKTSTTWHRSPRTTWTVPSRTGAVCCHSGYEICWAHEGYDLPELPSLPGVWRTRDTLAELAAGAIHDLSDSVPTGSWHADFMAWVQPRCADASDHDRCPPSSMTRTCKGIEVNSGTSSVSVRSMQPSIQSSTLVLIGCAR